MPSGVANHKDIPFAIGSNEFPGLSKLIEECGETLQEIGKIVGAASMGDHWDGRGKLKRRLEHEIADLMGAIFFVRKYNGLDADHIADRSVEKYEKFERWHRNIQAGRSPDDDG